MLKTKELRAVAPEVDCCGGRRRALAKRRPCGESPRRMIVQAVTLSVAAFFLGTADSDAQQGGRRSRALEAREQRVATDTIHINYPDSVDLSAFVDYVAQTLEVKIIYGDDIKNQSVVFRPAEVDIPKSQLLDLLRSMLRMRDFALIPSDVAGWQRIVPASDIQRHVGEIREGDAPGDAVSSNRVVTQVVPILSDDMQGLVNHAKDFLSSPKASIIQVPDKKLLIVTDYEAALARAIEIIRLVDEAPIPAELATVLVRHYDAKTLAAQVARAVADKAKQLGTKDPPLTIEPDLTGARIVLIGSQAQIEEAKSLIERFDVPQSAFRATVTYAPKYVSADRLLRLVESVVVAEGAGQDGLRSYLDQETNRLYVTASTAIHQSIADLLEAEDLPTMETSRPMRIYKPQHRAAAELIKALSEVLPNIMTSSANGTAQSSDQDSPPRQPPGQNRPPSEPGAGHVPPMPPAQEPIESAKSTNPQIRRITGIDFVLSFDEHTNGIIAIGPREFHQRLEDLIAELDQRRAQVLIAMTLVAVTFNDSLSLAVEVASEERSGEFQSLVFSSFGLSGIDLATGKRSFNPGGGINAVVLGPHETPFVLRAIAAHGNSRIITTPKMIVSDNTTATISNVEEAPFTSVNASDTVATTSFAGFESAGTTLTATPRIGEGDYLVLDYSFNFSNFTGQGTSAVPPPRSTNSFTGTVEIPDGHTIIVGGLVTENETDSVTEVPLLGRIPVIGALFQTSDRTRTKSRVYAFIRPTILRDDKFADLKYISERELQRAEIADQDYPPSTQLWMK